MERIFQGNWTNMTVGKYLDLVSPKTDAFWIGNNMGVDSNGHTVKRFPAKYNLALRLKKVPSIFKNICYYFTYNTQNRANGEIP